jgi:predicted 3-demethylubiquinone-9 3-methyltransferase (glyoxalase superfamily)
MERVTMQKTKPFLMFVGDACGKAEEAISLYTSLLPDSEIMHVERWAEGEPDSVPGQIKLATFRLAGTEYMASENSGSHAFGFTPAFSIFVECTDEQELRRLLGALVQGGFEMMPVGAYGFSTLFAWIADRYGVSWQLNLA